MDTTIELTIGVPGREQPEVGRVGGAPPRLVGVVAGAVGGAVSGGRAGGRRQRRRAGLGQDGHHGVQLGQHEGHLPHRQVVSAGAKGQRLGARRRKRGQRGKGDTEKKGQHGKGIRRLQKALKLRLVWITNQ